VFVQFFSAFGPSIILLFTDVGKSMTSNHQNNFIVLYRSNSVPVD